ncbi:MAG: lipid II:glycine glycyltransferase FemX [Promethearchaeota archaeon]
MGIKSKRRNMIRKAEKSHVEIAWGGCELLDDYYPMVMALSKKSGIRLQPEDFYKKVLERFGPSDEARIYLTRDKGEYLSGGIFLRFGEKGYYWHGASYPGMKNLGQNELIQWHVIQWLKTSGCSAYDMIGIEQERLPHIALFKLGFVNEIAPFEYIRFTPLRNKLYRGVYYLTRPQEAGRYLAGAFK